MSKEVLLRVANRFCLLLLLSLGLLLPLFRVLDLMAYAASGCLMLVLGCLVFSLTGLHKTLRVAIPLGTLAALVGWLVLGGADCLIEVARGLVLQSSGLTTALPLIAGKTALAATVLILLAAGITTSSEAGAVPSALLVILVLLALWIGDCAAAIPWTIPAIAAVLTMAACSSQGERNAFPVLPWMAVIAAAACLLVPQSGVTVEPLKEKADELRSRIYDYLFFTEARNVFSLANEGYYPQGADQMGGTATPTTGEILKVTTDRTVYLRGAIKDTYTGRTWKDTLGSKRYLWISPTRRSARSTIFDETLPAVESSLTASTVTVTMLADSTSSLLVPQRIRSLSVSGDMVAYFNDASEVFITRDLAEGDSYSVTALLLKAGDDGVEALVQACQSKADQTAYEEIVEQYTAVPDHVQSQVRELAWKAIEGAETPYQKAWQLQQWLKQYCTYTLEVDAQPTDVDFVSNFLLNTREGYCTYFASAMTVMCRLVGLPARYVEGFLATPGEDGTAIVTGEQGHAWTEVYFAGFGWLTFDATPEESRSNDESQRKQDQTENKQSTVTPTPEPQAATPTPAPTEEPTQEPTEAPDVSEPENTPAPENTPEPDDPDTDTQSPKADFPWLWLLLVLLLAAAIVGVYLRLKRTSPEYMAGHAADDTIRCEVWLQAVHDALRVMGKKRTAGESPMAYLERMSAEGLPSTLNALGALETLLCYSQRVPDAEDASVARTAWRDLYFRMDRKARIRYGLMRAVIPTDRRKWSL